MQLVYILHAWKMTETGSLSFYKRKIFYYELFITKHNYYESSRSLRLSLSQNRRVMIVKSAESYFLDSLKWESNEVKRVLLHHYRMRWQNGKCVYSVVTIFTCDIQGKISALGSKKGHLLVKSVWKTKDKTQFWNKLKLQKSVFEDSFGYQFSITCIR